MKTIVKVLPWPENLYCDILRLPETSWHDTPHDKATEEVGNWMTVLTQRETLVIEERYENGKTLREVAEECDVTMLRMRQIEARALKKMRQKAI